MKASTARVISDRNNSNIKAYTVKEVESMIKNSAERGVNQLYLQESNDRYIDQQLIENLIADGYKVYHLQLSKMLKIYW